MKIMKIICSVCTEIFETDSRKDFMCQRCVGVAEEAWNRLRDASLVKTPKDVQRVDYDKEMFEEMGLIPKRRKRRGRR